MLHMVTANHSADTCAATHPDVGEKLRNGWKRMEEASKRLEVTIQGAWVDPPAHAFYFLVDAPNAHAVSNLMIEIELYHWNTIEVHPVRTVDEAMPLSSRG